jgi:hypothetical protein
VEWVKSTILSTALKSVIKKNYSFFKSILHCFIWRITRVNLLWCIKLTLWWNGNFIFSFI